jgi:hypothetical protein
MVAGADVLVRQVLDFAPRIGDLDTRATVHLVPHVSAAFLWPHAGLPHPSNAPAPLLDASGPYPAEIGDSFLNRLIAQGVPVEEAVTRYLDTDVAKVRNVDRLMELFMDRQRARDRTCDFNFADFIEANFRTQWLFRTPNHPETPMSVMLAAEVFGRLGVDASIIKALRAQPPADMFPRTALPVHPGVIAHFGLSYVNPQTRYRYFDEGSFTFAEYVRRYMRYEWNPALPEALDLARQGHISLAIERMRQAIAASPRSEVGRLMLSEWLAGEGRLKDAVEVAYEAVLLDPQQQRYQIRLDQLLDQYYG